MKTSALCGGQITGVMVTVDPSCDVPLASNTIFVCLVFYMVFLRCNQSLTVKVFVKLSLVARAKEVSVRDRAK